MSFFSAFHHLSLSHKIQFAYLYLCHFSPLHDLNLWHCIHFAYLFFCHGPLILMKMSILGILQTNLQIIFLHKWYGSKLYVINVILSCRIIKYLPFTFWLYALSVIRSFISILAVREVITFTWSGDILFLKTLYNRGCWAKNKKWHTVNNVYYLHILFSAYNNA